MTGQKRSRVWLAIDKATNKCMLPDPSDKSKPCPHPVTRGGGTSGQRTHLKHHPDEWNHILATGEVKTSSQMIADALKAKVDQSKPALGEDDTAELHRLAAL